MKTFVLKTPITETAEQAKETESQNGKIAKQILLGIDAHENSYQVGRKIDAGGTQPPQSFKPDKLKGFVAKQLRLAEKVYVVYEAGPLGYVLYRELKELGVAVPRSRWAERGTPCRSRGRGAAPDLG
jgi:hypothetical protein